LGQTGAVIGPRKKKRFLEEMKFRPAAIYPLDSLTKDLDKKLKKGEITAEQYRIQKDGAEQQALSTGKWYVYYWHMHPTSGKFERFKVYEDINHHDDEAKISYAKNLKDAVTTALMKGYDPFQEEENLKEWVTEQDKQNSAAVASDRNIKTGISR
jgi:hypothetical protein